MLQDITITRKLQGPAYGSHLTMRELQVLARYAGSHFFDTDTMRFFRSKVYAGVYTGPDGWYFVTSERFSDGTPRRYPVRKLHHRTDDTGRLIDVDIDTVGEFQAYATGRAARRAASHYAQGAH